MEGFNKMTALYRDHYFDTIELLTPEQRELIRNNSKDYIVIDVQCTNTGAWIDLNLTNEFPDEDFMAGRVTALDDDSMAELIDNYEYATGKKFYN